MQDKFLKLTDTVYRIIEFFPESDPLKIRAKDKALAILENLVLAYDDSGWASFQKEKVKTQISEDIDVLLGYLWIGKSQGWLNSANFLIIAGEYDKIKKELAPIIRVTIPQDIAENQSAETILSPSPVLDSAGVKKEGVPVSFVFSDRQRKIMDFLTENEKAQVMDLQKILPNITKRTVRRDLDELLQLGKIIRLGEFNQVFYKIKS